MTWTLIIAPLAPYALMAAGLIVLLYLFWTIKMETVTVRRRACTRDDAIEGDGLRLRVQIKELEDYMMQAERNGILAPRSGLNLTSRAKALRMHRRGEAVASIAAALCLPRNEVDLLIKVHRLLVES